MTPRAAFTWVLLALLATTAAAADADDTDVARFKLPSVGGWVMTGDNETLIVSVPTKNQLVYFDTVADKEVRRVEVAFAPTSLALQGKTLFAAARGASLVYVLEADSGSQQKKIKIPGEPVLHLACNPESGPLYASTAKHRIFAIDPAAGKVVRTKGRGLLLAADPKGTALFAGMIKPYREKIKVSGGKDGALAIEFDNVGQRGTLLKYVPAGKDLKLVDGNANAAVGAGGALVLSPDGQKIVLVAAGGWSSLDKKDRSGPVVHGSADLKVALGAVPCPAAQDIAFHPVLNLGVALGNNVDLTLFDAKSLAVRAKISVAGAQHTLGLDLLAFGGKGTKIVHLQGENLSFIPISLTETERAALTEVYGKLPDRRKGD
jgi:hypothetical protein